MKISDKGVQFIKQFEGLSLVAYRPVPTEKHLTIGYGHYGADVQAGQTISKERAEQMLRSDIQRFELGVARHVTAPVNQDQFDALVSLAYNIGLGAFQSSTLLKKLNQKDYKGAAAEFGRWNKGGGKVLKGLVTRRQKERDLFEKGIAETIVQPSAYTTYRIKAGDTLSAIAKAHGTTTDKLMDLNPTIHNKNLIVVGQVLKVPKTEKKETKATTKKEETVSYTVKSGIAKTHKTTVKKIQSLNSDIKDPDKIQKGQKIKLPK